MATVMPMIELKTRIENWVQQQRDTAKAQAEAALAEIHNEEATMDGVAEIGDTEKP